MPRELTQLLVDEGVVGPDGVERALARQREAGGALDTALLELGLVAEEQLAGLLARASDLPPAPLSAYEAVDARARRVFPSKVAERHGLAPFALDGRELSLVATHPLDLGLLDEISFMLSLHLSPHVGPEWRVRSLIQRLYGGSLSPRLARLAEGAGPSGRAAPSAEPAGTATAAAPAEAVRTVAPPRSVPARPSGFTGFSRAGDEPLEPLAAALAQAAEAFELDWEAEALASPLPAAAAAEAGPPAVGPPPQASPQAPAPRTASPPPPDRSAPPRWTVAAARAALGEATTRDEVVLTALRYARDFFQYAALFAVTRDAVAGHDGLGPEDGTRDVVRTVALYVTDPGIFRTTLDTLSPYLGPVARDASGSAAVLDGLGRGTPRTALVFPVLLRGRPICILYADNGQAPVSARRLGDLLLLLSMVGGAFERILRARKGGGQGAAAPLPATRLRPAQAVGPAVPGPRAQEAVPPALEQAPAAAEAVFAAPGPEAIVAGEAGAGTWVEPWTAPAPGAEPRAEAAVEPAPEASPERLGEPVGEASGGGTGDPAGGPMAETPTEAGTAAAAALTAEGALEPEGPAPAPAEELEPQPEDHRALAEPTPLPPEPSAEPGGPGEGGEPQRAVTWSAAEPAGLPEPESLPGEVSISLELTLERSLERPSQATAVAVPPGPPPVAATRPPGPGLDLAEVEEAFFSSAPGRLPPDRVDPGLPPLAGVALPAGPAAPSAPPTTGEVSISIELTLEKPLGTARPPSPAAPAAPGEAAPAVAVWRTQAPPSEPAEAYPELPSLPGAEASRPPPVAPDPASLEITLERPLKPPAPPAPLDPAALVGTYLVSQRGSDDRAYLLGKMVERAEEVAPVLCEQLPGPLDVAPEALATTPATDQGPVLAAVAALGPAALQPLLALLADAAPARRRAAAALLGQLGDPTAFLPLQERCFDADPAVAEAARTALALHRRDPAMKPVPERLRRALLSGLADRAAPAARAIAALRDAESIPLLIQALEGSDAATAAASAEALAAITLQRHGVKARDWLLWWKQNRARSRSEWLFGALTSGDRELRLLAANELRQVAATPVSYSADLPEAERQAAAQAWQRWFTKGGHRP